MYPLLTLTDKSQAVLAGEEKVMLTKTKERIDVDEPVVKYETDLLQKLKVTRRELANLLALSTTKPTAVLFVPVVFAKRALEPTATF
jgi:hypothetical protein